MYSCGAWGSIVKVRLGARFVDGPGLPLSEKGSPVNRDAAVSRRVGL